MYVEKGGEAGITAYSKLDFTPTSLAKSIRTSPPILLLLGSMEGHYVENPSSVDEPKADFCHFGRQ